MGETVACHIGVLLFGQRVPNWQTCVSSSQVAAPRVSVLELLARHRSLLAAFDLSSLVCFLPRIKPRYYSIASSPRTAPDRCGWPADVACHDTAHSIALYSTPRGRARCGSSSSSSLPPAAAIAAWR
jgi:hypothetical protein